MDLMFLSAILIQLLRLGTVFAIVGPLMTKPNCMETCGNLTIPYPFGLGIHCSMNQAFNLSCTNTSTVNPPKLLWGSHEVANVSVEGEMIITTAISYDCLEQGGRQSSRIVLAGNSSFTFSSTKNKFTAIGCNTVGLFTGPYGDNFTGGCASYCTSDEAASDGLCNGIGCCQTAIPQGVTELDLSLQSLTNNRSLASRLSCGYAFVVDESMFSFRASDLRDDSLRTRTVPVVVDWAIGGVGDTCETTEKKNRTCGIDGECLNSPAGQGYRCRCRQGFEGNPYIEDGCQDVDECERKVHNCSDRATCVNKRGSFDCQCPQGEEGDGRNGGSSCTEQGERSVPVAEIVLGACGSALFLLLGISRLVWKYNKAKSRTPKGKYYSRNGGHILESRAFLDQDLARIKIFKEKELRKAINKILCWRRVMHEDKEGGQRVYKGTLEVNRLVAIHEVDTKESEIETFVNQIVDLYKMGEQNMIQLVGCCFETELPLIVYEFVPRHGDANKQNLDDLLQIAQGTAKLLTDPPPIAISLTTLMFFPIRSKENEVFCFGVALVELLTGKKPISYHKFQHKGIHHDIATQCMTLLGEAPLLNSLRDSGSDQGTVILELARCCLKENTMERPKMEEVVSELNRIRDALRNRADEV